MVGQVAGVQHGGEKMLLLMYDVFDSHPRAQNIQACPGPEMYGVCVCVCCHVSNNVQHMHMRAFSGQEI